MDDLNPQQDVQHTAPVRPVPALSPPPRKSRWRRLFWIVLAIAVIAAVVWWIRARPAQQRPPGRFAASATMPVVAATAAKGDIEISLNALGTVTALATVTVQTQINGQLTQIAFKEGQMVNKGDFLAQIDSRPYQAALDQAQGTLMHDQALLKGAQVDLARYKTLAAQNSIAKQQADDQDALVHQYEGTVKSDQAQVENAQLNLAYCRIVAPVGGRIGLRQIDPGNYVQTGNATGIAVITQLQPISVIFTMPEDNLPQVMKRLQSGAVLPVTVTDRSGANKLATGTLAAVDTQIDTTTGTVKVRAQFDNADDALFPNQFVNARLLVDTLHDATVIPSSAVQRGSPGTFVYMIKPDDTVTVQKITLGPQNGERQSVKSGLSPGDKVVVDGADKLKEGAKISLRQENTGTPPANGAASGQAPAQATPGQAQPNPAPTGQAPTGQAPTGQAQPNQVQPNPAQPDPSQPDSSQQGQKRQRRSRQ